MQRPLIIALDFKDQQEVHEFLQHFQQEQLFVKVGMELFYQEGPDIISYLKKLGHNIFLDLKLHDIPNTVKQAMRGLAKLDVDIVNVHAAGGKKMMEAAIEGLEAGTQEGKTRPMCIAVTQLTSTSQDMIQEELLIKEDINDVVLHYAQMAKESGLDGVVCSTHEVEKLNEKFGTSFMTVTPGIRMKEDSTDDQTRIATPDQARRLGSTAIVVGRSITKQDNPYEAYLKVKKAWEESEE
ncbi:orotidine-5'-phosphate decarboxylase [Metabacillus litoralis]|uniref:orotidine-5'-phosphate decarboxylase n=1 Tax=Metabacillus TaxID=2675233 RepID=UPI001B954986|nr:orotidine-5'-phosphate decarboxylase [Metabacillus litoralis]MCM3160430.1 orotidine-5'-phosphate decarboxylase [Metabacillus litoralis]MCM3409015.1 orotidine-5'-phosphate decarboxylase [Metabacillus litoralis]UHA59355.1 orotidine-5'-phosphate decarboxylase [Metabacillus litoralis]